jgi:transcriptional regulator with XRE-family HTH domain
MPAERNPKGPAYLRLGRAMRRLRRTAGISQVRAGELAKVRGEFVSHVERGKRGMTWETLLALLDAYGARLVDLERALEAEK